ncbi:MAG: hypothetical protein Kow0047_32510 [Anaerolineae bacterium]
MPPNDLTLSYDVTALPTGAALGNEAVWALADAESNLQGLYNAGDGRWYCGMAHFAFTASGQPLEPLVTRFFPGYQETIYGAEGIVLSKRIFVPYGTGYPQSVCWQMDFETEGHHYIQIDVDIRWPALPAPAHRCVPAERDLEQRVRQEMDRGLVVARDLENSRRIRIFGSNGPPSRVVFVEPGRARLSFFVLAEGYVDVPFILTFSPAGEQLAWNGFLANGETGVLLRESERRMEQAIRRARVMTPDVEVNRALAWASVNVLRARHRFRQATAIASSIASDRLELLDAAWYGLGADYLASDFARGIWEMIGQRARREDGVIAATMDLTTGGTDDRGHNLTAATPLFVIGARHHYVVHREASFLERIYPAVRDAADAIIRQRRGDLVYVQMADDATNARGIAGWRHRIPGYRLAGAVTEVNALSAWALRCAGELAAAHGDTVAQARFESEAAALADAVNRSLLSEESGLYRLALSPAGEPLDDLTCDQVFPLLAGIAPDDVRGRMVERMWSPAWMSAHGLRTVGEDEPAYDPRFAEGLMGGVWPRAEIWLAMADRSNPERLVRALRHLIHWCVPEEADRLDRVPGHFPTWLDGESGEALGAPADPITPSLALWLAIEGLMGITPGLDEIRIDPAIPDGWTWMVCRDVPLGGQLLTAIWHDGALHVSRPVVSAVPMAVYDGIEPHRQDWRAFILRRGDQRWVFACAPDEAWSATLRVDGARVSVDLAPGEAVLLPVR